MKKKGAAKIDAAPARRRVPFRPEAAQTWKVKWMPKDLKQQLDQLLCTGKVHTSMALKKWLAANGFEISSRCISQYRHKFESQLQSVRLATAQAREVCKQFKDDDEQMQTALMRLVQTRLFEILAVANEQETSQNQRTLAPTVAAVNVVTLARCVSGLVKAEVEHRKLIEHIHTGIAAAEKKLEEARAKGLSKDAADQIKAVLLEVRG